MNLAPQPVEQELKTERGLAPTQHLLMEEMTVKEKQQLHKIVTLRTAQVCLHEQIKLTLKHYNVFYNSQKMECGVNG